METGAELCRLDLGVVIDTKEDDGQVLEAVKRLIQKETMTLTLGSILSAAESAEALTAMSTSTAEVRSTKMKMTPELLRGIAETMNAKGDVYVYLAEQELTKDFNKDAMAKIIDSVNKFLAAATESERVYYAVQMGLVSYQD